MNHIECHGATSQLYYARRIGVIGCEESARHVTVGAAAVYHTDHNHRRRQARPTAHFGGWRVRKCLLCKAICTGGGPKPESHIIKEGVY